MTDALRMDELQTLAVAGSASATAAPSPSHPADSVAPAGETVEGVILRRGGARAIYEAAGATAVACDKSLPPLPPPDERVAPAGGSIESVVGDSLSRDDDETSLVGRLLIEMERQSVMLPPGSLPTAINAIRRDRGKAFEPLLGTRGQWLMSLMPRRKGQSRTGQTTDLDLSGESDRDLRRRFDEADERVAAVREMRRRDPATAREWIAATFKTEPVDERITLIECLDLGLGPDDEPLLDRGVGDRANLVSIAAAERLRRLPESAYMQRMAERIESSLTLSGTGNDRTIKLDLPKLNELPKDWARDGLDVPRADTRLPAGPIVGRRARAAVALLRHTRPERLAKRYAMKPLDLIAAMRDSYAEFAVLDLWTEQTLDPPPSDAVHQEWAAALSKTYRELLGKSDTETQSHALHQIGRLAAVAGRERLFDDALELFCEQPNLAASAMRWIGQLPRPWSVRQAETFEAITRERLASDPVKRTIVWIDELPPLATAIPRERLDSYRQPWTLCETLSTNEGTYALEHNRSRLRRFEDTLHSWQSLMDELDAVVSGSSS